MSHKSALLLGPATLLSLTPTSRADSLWIEAESVPNPPAASSTGFAKPEWLSGGKVLSLTLDPKQVEAALPADGLILSYPLALTKAGNYTPWNRVGFEGVRAAFEWRVNQGPWTLNSQVDQPITNLQELAFWNPIGWTRLGTANLTAGKHTLDIRLTRTLADPKITASQAFCRNPSLRPGTQLS